MDTNTYKITKETKIPALRPDYREQILEKGAQFLGNNDLVALLLGSGTKEMSIEKLAAKVLTVLQIEDPESRLDKLLHIKGIGLARASVFIAAMELGRRFYSNQSMHIKNPKDILPLLQHYSLEKQEHFICTSLNGANEIIETKTVYIGTLNKVYIHPRDIFAGPIVTHASAIILSHNHPSNTPYPSQEDIETTERLCNVGRLVGIQVLDHIIITKNEYYSFLEHDLVVNE